MLHLITRWFRWPPTHRPLARQDTSAWPAPWRRNLPRPRSPYDNRPRWAVPPVEVTEDQHGRIHVRRTDRGGRS